MQKHISKILRFILSFVIPNSGNVKHIDAIFLVKYHIFPH